MKITTTGSDIHNDVQRGWLTSLRVEIQQALGLDDEAIHFTFVAAEPPSTVGTMLVELCDLRETQTKAQRDALEGGIGRAFTQAGAPSSVRIIHLVCMTGHDSYSFDPRATRVGMMA